MYKPFVKAGMKVMDVGCGAGYTTIGLAKIVGENGLVTAVDIQEEMLNLLKTRKQKGGLDERILTHCCDVGSLDINDKFDFVNAFWMVHEVPDHRGFMKKIKERLATGGCFFVAEPKIHVTRKNFELMVGKANEAGLTVKERPKVKLSSAVVFM